MLATRTRGDGQIVIYFLHWLSGSGAAWNEVADHLLQPGRFRLVQIDLPGFGNSAEVPGYSVAEMTEEVIAVIEQQVLRSGSHSHPWMLVAHSLGAKVAAAVARRAEDGQPSLVGLQAMVLLAGSPPAPEPMDETRRTEMQGWFASDEASIRAEAKTFIERNCAKGLAKQVELQAIEDVLSMNRAAWLAWLNSGNREEWSRRIGVLRTPAILGAGEKDAELGEDAQRALMMPHFAQVELRVLPGAKHLLPLEFPHVVAHWIEEASRLHAIERPAFPILPAAYELLIASDRVSPQTRAVLLSRGRPDDLWYQPATLDAEQLAVLRVVAERVVPQNATEGTGAWIDLAARLDQQLTAGHGNGWRYDVLPPDSESCRAGIDTLNAEAKAAHGAAFVALPADTQDDLLGSAARGVFGANRLQRVAMNLGLHVAAEDHALDGEQMKRWFEEVRGDLVRLYVAHPATLARIGFSGVADGGDAETMDGFVQLGVGAQEPWGPAAVGMSGKAAGRAK